MATSKLSLNPPAERLVSLDAFRGAIMLLMASSGFGIPQIADRWADTIAWYTPGYAAWATNVRMPNGRGARSGT